MVTLSTWWVLMTLSASGPVQPPSKKKGAGTKMLDDMRKKGKPITPKLEEMALWLDSMDTSTLDDGQVTLTCVTLQQLSQRTGAHQSDCVEQLMWTKCMTSCFLHVVYSLAPSMCRCKW